MAGGGDFRIEREDLTAILSVLFGIKLELTRIRRALEDGNGEEGEEREP